MHGRKNIKALFFFHYYNQGSVTSHAYKVMAFCPDCVSVSVFPSIIGILCAVEGC